LKQTLAWAIVFWAGSVVAHANPISLGTFSVNPQATFLLQTSNDNCSFPAAAPGCTPSSFDPTFINLSGMGVQVGDVLDITALGSFCFYPQPNCTPEPAYLGGVFDQNNVLLGSSYLNRLPGAVSSNLPNITDPGTETYYGSLSTFIPQDFYISPLGTLVSVPVGGAYLVIGVLDSFYADNTGSISVSVTDLGQQSGVPEPASYGLVWTGIAALAMFRKKLLS
jgi:hypothetical protein